jgi:hypothetical protein
MDFSDPASPHTFSSLDQYVSMLNLDYDGPTGTVIDHFPHIQGHNAIGSTVNSGASYANTESSDEVGTARWG